MTDIMVWGGLGLLFGITAQRCGFATAEGVYGAASLRRGGMARTFLYLLGIGMLLTAFLGYLAVIDVDLVEVLPLHAGVILGGLLFGATIGLAGMLPATALAGIGGGRLLESLSAAAGCVAGAYLSRMLPVDVAQRLFPPLQATLFRVRLDGAYLFSGGFLALACLGALLCVAALLIPVRRHAFQPDSDLLPCPASDERMTDAFVALVPEEEPLIVDTPEITDELVALDAISLTAVSDEETDLPAGAWELHRFMEAAAEEASDEGEAESADEDDL